MAGTTARATDDNVRIGVENSREKAAILCCYLPPSKPLLCHGTTTDP